MDAAMKLNKIGIVSLGFRGAELPPISRIKHEYLSIVPGEIYNRLTGLVVTRG